MTTNTTNTVRANRIAVQSKGDIIVATFWRTHVRVATMTSNTTGWVPEEGANKAAQVEDFRRFAIRYAADIGVEYDPDKHMVVNVRPTYETEDDVWADFDLLNLDTIRKLTNGSKYGMEFKGLTHDSMEPLTKTPKGTDLAGLGIEDGRYTKSGKMAWFSIHGFVEMVHKDSGTPISVSVEAMLASGQMKKISVIGGTTCNLVQKNMDEAIRLELGLAGVEIPSKAEAKAEAKEVKVGLGDEEHEGLHMDMTPEEEAKAMAEAEEYLKAKKTTKRTSKKSTKAEAETANA